MAAVDVALDPEIVESSYLALIAEHPDALVSGVRREGLFVELPESFPIAGHGTLQGRSGIDLVVPEDRGRVIAAWDAMLARGAAECVVHLAVDPAATVTFHFFDAQPAYGVYLHVITSAGAAEPSLYTIFEGTSETQRLVIGRALRANANTDPLDQRMDAPR